MNRYPLWKYILLIAVVIFGIIYSLPNLYGEDPALQITGKGSALISEDLQNQVSAALAQNHIAYKSIQMTDDNLLVRFTDTNQQLNAQPIVESSVGNNYTVSLNLASSTPHWLTTIGATPMKLGLDLRGGVHFLLDVDVEGVIKHRLSGDTKNIRDILREAKVRYISVHLQRDNHILMLFKEADDQNKARDILAREMPDLLVETPKENPMQLSAQLSPAAYASATDAVMDQTMTTLRNRVNELGISEATVQRQGLNRVVVDLPGIQDTGRAKQILGGTATLEFHLVNQHADVGAALSGNIPMDSRLYKMTNGAPILLYNQIILKGSSITGATSSMGEDGRPSVTILLGGGGESYFTRMTRENVGRSLAIVYIETQSHEQTIDGKVVRTHEKKQQVINSAVIQSPLGNNFQITGLDNQKEASNLALLLRAGALPANIDIVEERTVGPTLGMENIHRGVMAIEIGLFLAILFMAIYYRGMGLIADLALLMNLVVLVAMLSLMGMVLTLPGIAGILLTVGMAVDANVLIFERIREEIRNGASMQASIYAGYERAFSTIVDANVTTLIAATALFSLGSGPVKGFAITLIVGLLTSMLTAIGGTRAIVNLLYGNRNVKHISIGI